jgi:hypothetical protein
MPLLLSVGEEYRPSPGSPSSAPKSEEEKADAPCVLTEEAVPAPVPVESDVPPAPGEQAASPVTVQPPARGGAPRCSHPRLSRWQLLCARTIPPARRRPCTSPGLQGFVQGVAGAEEARASEGGGGCTGVREGETAGAGAGAGAGVGA